MLPKRINNNESMVINLQDYFKGDGTRWVTIYNNEDSNMIEFFNSFGLQTPI